MCVNTEKNTECLREPVPQDWNPIPINYNWEKARQRVRELGSSPRGTSFHQPKWKKMRKQRT